MNKGWQGNAGGYLAVRKEKDLWKNVDLLRNKSFFVFLKIQEIVKNQSKNLVIFNIYFIINMDSSMIGGVWL